MTWIYAGILAVLAAVSVLTRNCRKNEFRELKSSDHPLKRLYPMAAAVLAGKERLLGKGKNSRIRSLLKSLYVKENIEKETYIYRIKKTALVIAAVSGMVLLGFFVCLANAGITLIRTLDRAGHGGSSIEYELEADYRGRTDEISIRVDPVQYTESEIIELFENSFDDVEALVLGENESRDHVTKPLDLIREYHGFAISWDIEDISSVNYNGDLKADLREGEERTVNLFAVFSMDGVTELFSFPVNLVGETAGEQSKLLDSILDEIEQTNDIHSSQVVLPEEIGGYRIEFRRKQEDNRYLFLLLALCAGVLILLFYDRNLEQKVKKRQDEMMLDFTEIVSKLSLLYEAGLSIHGSFERVVSDYEKKLKEKPILLTGKGKKKKQPPSQDYHFAYREMKLALEKINRGESEAEAYSGFGRRCGLYPYIKLGNLLEQNLNKGTRGMQELLKKEVEDAFEERKRIARKKGEEAGTKLLLPMAMMLAVVIAIVAIPALMSMSF